MAITLYMQIFSAPVRSVIFTAEALGLKLQKKIVDLSKGEHLTDAFLKINPQHTIPTLDDNGTIIWDSHAINAYLVGKYGKNDSLYPKDLVKRSLVDQRLHFDSGSIFAWLRIVSRGIKYNAQTSLLDYQIAGITDGYGYLETFLEGRQWVTGNDVTIADFSLVASVTTLNLALPVDPKKYPSITCWLKRAESLPGHESNLEGLEKMKAVFQNLK